MLLRSPPARSRAARGDSPRRRQGRSHGIDKSATTYVAGHRGLVGSAIWRRLEADGYTNLVGRTSPRWTCATARRHSTSCDEVRPRYLILAAARVGGILANDHYPAEFLSDNLRIQVNVMDAAHEADVERLRVPGLVAASTPSSPRSRSTRTACSPAPLEPTNDAYAIAKIAGILQVQAAAQAVRPPLDLRHAHQPLRPRRQLRPGRPRTCCPP